MPEGEVDCLTVEEELKLVAFYCRQTIQLGDHLKVPTDVKVGYPLNLLYTGRKEADFEVTGNRSSIHKTLLHHKFGHDIPS